MASDCADYRTAAATALLAALKGLLAAHDALFVLGADEPLEKRIATALEVALAVDAARAAITKADRATGHQRVDLQVFNPQFDTS